MSLLVVVPVLGRPAALAAVLATLRAAAGMDVQLCVVVDGDPDVPWHAVDENAATARAHADTTVVLGAHHGNGAAMQAGAVLVAAGEPYVLHDADVIGSARWAQKLLTDAQRWDDGKLGVLAALPDPRIARWAVGPRVLSGRRGLLRLALYTPRGQAAVGDHTTTRPLGAHDVLVRDRLYAAGLWSAYSNHAWVEQHLQQAATPEDAAYRAWAVDYRWAPRGGLVQHG